MIRRIVAYLARIRHRLLLVNVLVAAVPIAGIGFARLHEAQLLASLEHDMIHQAQLVRATVDAHPSMTLPEHERMLRASARYTRTRIRLLDQQGNVVADSHASGAPEGREPQPPQLLGSPDAPSRPPEVPAPTPVADRREVQAALAGRYGSATRMWTSESRVFLFSALPMQKGVVYVTKSTTDVKLQLFHLRSWLLRVLIITLLGTTLLSLLLSTTIARPLARLTRRAEQVAARQPVEPYDALVRRTDEIGQLARAVGSMTDELERRAHDARTLAADISHELKTPLAGIRGATELLRDGAADDPDDRERFLAMIADDAARIERDLARLLELARTEADRAPPVPVDLAELARSCAARPWPRPITLELAADLPVVRARPSQLTAALENLVANATQHATPDTPITITIAPHDAALRIAVTNTGPALSEAAQRRVWDRFYTTRVGAGGTGLGLAIVRSVAHAHGGDVGVRCDAGRTTFWLDVAR